MGHHRQPTLAHQAFVQLIEVGPSVAATDSKKLMAHRWPIGGKPLTALADGPPVGHQLPAIGGCHRWAILYQLDIPLVAHRRQPLMANS